LLAGEFTFHVLLSDREASIASIVLKSFIIVEDDKLINQDVVFCKQPPTFLSLIMPITNLIPLRLQNQQLSQQEFRNPADLVYNMGAVQAQDYTGAKWALGMRLKGCTDELIEKAFTDGDMIRTHVLRPTWHFVHPKDIRWMLELTARRIQALAASRHRQLGLDTNVLSKCESVITKAFNGHKQLSRDIISDTFQKNGIVTNEQRFVHIMMHLELEQVVCSGGREGKQFTYALFDSRIPKTKTISKEQALAMLVERYFISHGPATMADFVWWSGLTTADAKTGLEAKKAKLSSFIFEDNTYWFAEQSHPPIIKPGTALLLPNYDEYIVSYKDRSATIAAQNLNLADPRGTIFNHTLILNGQIEGIWKRMFKKDMLELEIIPFKKLSIANVNAVEKAAKRYADFLALKNVIIK
jgi:hypothetical protein